MVGVFVGWNLGAKIGLKAPAKIVDNILDTELRVQYTCVVGNKGA